MRAHMLTFTALLLVLASACVDRQDDPTTVHDLRVLGMQLDPPEVLITRCNAGSLQKLIATQADGGSLSNLDPLLLFELLSVASQPLDFRALIVDPKGNGRALHYRLSACTDISDRTCANPDKRALLNEGDFAASGTNELALQVAPVSELHDGGLPSIRSLPNGTAVLLDVLQNDTFRGLGGIRVPLVLELTAPDSGEHVYAQKLMPYVCKFLPDMTQNVLPVLPGMTVLDAGWDAGVGLELSGHAEIAMDAVDFTPLQETYVLPSLQLRPVTLTESWKIAHYATSGTMSPYETGGTNLGGGVSRSNFKWTPDSAAKEPVDVTFYFVARDGRGGESWLTRQAHWSP